MRQHVEMRCAYRELATPGMFMLTVSIVVVIAGSIRDWDGIVLGGDPERVTELNLPEWGLSGRIPSQLYQLDRIESVHLKLNELSGPIPPELGQLANLESLVLFANDLSGPIPPELGQLANLESLDLRSNKLSGPIPAELGDLTMLRYLYIAYNPHLTGCVPAALRNSLDLASSELGMLDFCDS